MPEKKSKAKNTEEVAPRSPIVVIMGHVDHGKTTILDTIRKTRVAAKEAGGITQHIGAYIAEINGRKVTFLDTPGHEAFTAIRSRGANAADIAVLVIAAEEGLKPQTKEAIKIIKDVDMPFIVAINKMDAEGANPQKVRQELAENEVMVEDYGGQVPVVELSGKTGKGVDQLLETILLVAEVEELPASNVGPAEGFVIESHMDSRRGTVATLLVQSGVLNVGDWISAGASTAKVKMLEDFVGKATKSIGTSEPCVVLGWDSVPVLGTKFKVVKDQKEAKTLSDEAKKLAPSELFLKTKKVSTEGVESKDKKVATIIIKADVQSSLEAIDQVLQTIHSDDVEYNVISHGVGNINDSDVKQAEATGAAIIGFHVDADPSAKRSVERGGVRMNTFTIIYELVELVRDIMSDLLDPEIRRNDLGKLKILAIFGTQGKTQIVGGKVTQGKISRGALADIQRGGKILTKGKIVQLQHKKADVADVAEGLECGLRVDVSPSELGIPVVIKEGDFLEIFQEEKIKRSI